MPTEVRSGKRHFRPKGGRAMDETRSEGLVTLPPPGEADPAQVGESAQATPPATGPVMPQRQYFDWRTFDPAIHIHKNTPMAEEMITYAAHLDELLAHEGQYVLIKGREIVGIFPTQRAALDEAVDRFDDYPAMVMQITALEPIERLGHVVF
jgi:hypothetical protein